jgi:hypothetical protein
MVLGQIERFYMAASRCTLCLVGGRKFKQMAGKLKSTVLPYVGPGCAFLRCVSNNSFLLNKLTRKVAYVRHSFERQLCDCVCQPVSCTNVMVETHLYPKLYYRVRWNTLGCPKLPKGSLRHPRMSKR